jgi:hypothetical protein
MTLSTEYVLVFVLAASGARGRLTSGHVEVAEEGDLRVYDPNRRLNSYVSGRRLRSWQVFYRGQPLANWGRVAVEDAEPLARDEQFF